MDKAEKVKLLHRYSKTGNVAELEEVLEDPDIKECLNRRAGGHKRTALHEACQENQVHVVETLLSCESISVDPLDGRNWTPLCYAVDVGNVLIVEKLIDKGANVKHVLNNGDTPLHIAAMKINIKMCELLLQHGADVSAANYNKWTVLHIATGEGEYSLCKLFLHHKAPVDSATSYGDTPANMAARNDCEDILKLLKAQKADFNIGNNQGESPVHSAAMGGHSVTLKYLIQNGADVMKTDNKKLNIFHYAAKNGHIEIFYLMKDTIEQSQFSRLITAKTAHIGSGMWVSTIGCGINLSQVTPLHLAAIEGHPHIVKQLIQFGAQKEVKDGNSHTPLELVTHYKSQIQVWDTEKVNQVREILQQDLLNQAQMPAKSEEVSCEENRASSAASEINNGSLYSWDSAYYSTSSCTTEGISSRIIELEDQLRQLNVSSPNSARMCRRKRRALKRQVEKSTLQDEEKSNIYDKLAALEEKLQKITENAYGVSSSGNAENQHCDQTSVPQQYPNKDDLSIHEGEEIARKVRSHFTTFIRELIANDHIHFLFQKGALELDDIEKIENKSNEEDRVKTLMYILFRKPRKHVWTAAFLESLENNDHTSHLAQLLIN